MKKKKEIESQETISEKERKTIRKKERQEEKNAPIRMGYRSAEQVEDDVCIYQPLYVFAVEERRVQGNLSREWGGRVSEAGGSA